MAQTKACRPTWLIYRNSLLSCPGPERRMGGTSGRGCDREGCGFEPRGCREGRLDLTPSFLSKELPFAFPLEMLPEEVVRGRKGERRSALGGACVWLDLSPYPWGGTHAEQGGQRQKTVPLYWFCVPETSLPLSGPVFSSVKWKL